MRTYRIDMMRKEDGIFKTIEIEARTRKDAERRFQRMFGEHWIIARAKVLSSTAQTADAAR